MKKLSAAEKRKKCLSFYYWREEEEDAAAIISQLCPAGWKKRIGFFFNEIVHTSHFFLLHLFVPYFILSAAIFGPPLLFRFFFSSFHFSSSGQREWTTCDGYKLWAKRSSPTRCSNIWTFVHATQWQRSQVYFFIFSDLKNLKTRRFYLIDKIGK